MPRGLKLGTFCLFLPGPVGPPSVAQTLAGFLFSVRSDDYVSDLCVFPQWGARLRIVHVTAGSLSLQTQPCRGMLVSGASASKRSNWCLSRVTAASFSLIQQVFPQVFLLWAVITYSNSSGVYIRSVPNQKCNLYLNTTFIVHVFVALQTTPQMLSSRIDESVSCTSEAFQLGERGSFAWGWRVLFVCVCIIGPNR